ncbi:MAG: FG-GAP-like repeat-containing protein, partial [Verrucomicrobiota bacterium]
ETEDSDLDEIEDWYELFYFGNLAQNGFSDTDTDGFDLESERFYNFHPKHFDLITEGGISRRQSSVIELNLASYPAYDFVSNPAGIIDLRALVPPGTSVSSPNLLDDINSDYRFAYWEIGGVIQQGADGSALGQLDLLITEDITATAIYVPVGLDSDSDLIPDWYEYNHFTNLDQDGSSDTDLDGWDLASEIFYGFHPIHYDNLTEGGVSIRQSSLAPVNFSGFSTYQLTSSPSGIIDISATVPDGYSVTSPELFGHEANGYRFAYWEIDSIIQKDQSGQALAQLELTINEDLEAIAVFVPLEEDSDEDGIYDWYEWNYYSSLEYGGLDDTEGDGWNLEEEIFYQFHPNQFDALVDGGISRRQSAAVRINLQAYERLEKFIVDGTLIDFFSPDPNVATGVDFGSATATAVTDWDGDGDFDLFVAYRDGLNVWQNQGIPNLENNTASFANLGSFVSTLTKPVLSGGDWNNDDLGDLVIVDGQSVRLVESNGNFQHSGSGVDLSIESPVVSASLLDYNNDGFDELFALMPDGRIRVYWNQGSPNYFLSSAFEYLGNVSIQGGLSITTGDINQDGLGDILAIDISGRIWELHQNENQSFSIVSKIWGGSFAGFAPNAAISALDLENDGDLDLIGGISNGRIWGLRDPRVGRPSGLLATAGASSVHLKWNPDWQSQIVGYNVYRSTNLSDLFSGILPTPTPLPNYWDTAVAPFTTYTYYIRAVSQFLAPGNSKRQLIESPPSEDALATSGQIKLSLGDLRALPEHIVRVSLAINNSLGLSGEGLHIEVAYDPSVIQPINQLNPFLPSVRKTALSRNIEFATDEESEPGIIAIQGESGSIQPGNGNLFVLQFRIVGEVSEGDSTELRIEASSMFSEEGFRVGVVADSPAQLKVDGAYILGDVNGDGSITDDDRIALRDLLWPFSRKPTQEELTAGDLNGDNQLTLQDLVLIKRLLENLSIY